MSETKDIKVPFEGEASDRAVLLLAAAEELNLPASVVRTSLGGFLVPEEVEDKAFGGKYAKRQAEEEAAWEQQIEEARGTEATRLTDEPDAPAEAEANDDDDKPKPAKKAAAKKSTTTKGQ